MIRVYLYEAATLVALSLFMATVAVWAQAIPLIIEAW